MCHISAKLEQGNFMHSPTPQKNLLPPWLIYKPPTQSALSNLGLVLGKAKLAPPSEHSIPRLELCAVVLAVEAAQFVALEQLDL